MNSMNARLKLGLGLSKRKSSANAPSQPQLATQPQPLGTPPLGTPNSGVLPGQPRPQSTASSASSIPSMNHPGAGGRPPSYTPGYPAPMGQRTTSPPMPQGPVNPRTPPSQVMGGPPPINTAASGGYPPAHGPPPAVGPPLQTGGGPPQYGGAPYPPAQGTMGAPQYAARNNAVEVEGAGRSKSQLIVGIDFVSFLGAQSGRTDTNMA
jgi:hypothetical protein